MVYELKHFIIARISDSTAHCPSFELRTKKIQWCSGLERENLWALIEIEHLDGGKLESELAVQVV